MSGRAVEFATFWHGPFPALTYACLASFPAVGARLRLYAYDVEIEAPHGVEVRDAREIVADASLVGRYRVAGQPSLATFSDRFRCDLMTATDCCWVDADIVCLKTPEFADPSIIWGLQTEAHGKALINNAVLKLPAGHPVLREMRARAEAAVDVDVSWGAIGPFLLTDLAEAHGVYATARPQRDFYPIGPDEFWKLLLPRYREEVAGEVAQATFLHLWSELLRRCGYDPALAPPAGSFLHGLIERLGVLHRFRGVYDERELRKSLSDWLAGEEAA